MKWRMRQEEVDISFAFPPRGMTCIAADNEAACEWAKAQTKETISTSG